MLPKCRRLKRLEVKRVKRSGQVFYSSDFSIIISSQSLGYSRFSIITSLSFHKRAHIRNNFRRRIYPILSSVTPPVFDLILIPSARMLEYDNEKINSLLSAVLSKVPLV